MEEHPGALSLLVGCFVQYARRACVLWSQGWGRAYKEVGVYPRATEGVVR